MAWGERVRRWGPGPARPRPWGLVRALVLAGVLLLTLAVGGTWGFQVLWWPPELADPPRLLDWPVRDSGIQTNLLGVTHGKGLFVAVGDSSRVLSSPDGVTWTPRASGLGHWDHLESIAYGNGRFVAVGARGVVISSEDGVSWTPGVTMSRRESGPTQSWLLDVTYAAGQFVAVGELDIFTSPDGVRWRDVTPGPHLAAVTYGQDQFIAVGGLARVLGSPDGMRWSRREVGRWPLGWARETLGRQALSGVAYGAGRFVAVGYTEKDGAILTSTDGLRWEWSRHLSSADYLRAVIYAEDQFVAVGNYRALTSPDGLEWESYRLPSERGLYAITYGKGRFVAVGFRGTVMTSK